MANNFITSNPFPSYQDVEDLLDDAFRIDLSAEYCESHHNQCRAIYENLYNDDIIMNAAKQIFNCGGPQALNANLIILQKYSPLGRCTCQDTLARFRQIMAQYRTTESFCPFN